MKQPGKGKRVPRAAGRSAAAGKAKIRAKVAAKRAPSAAGQTAAKTAGKVRAAPESPAKAKAARAPKPQLAEKLKPRVSAKLLRARKARLKAKLRAQIRSHGHTPPENLDAAALARIIMADADIHDGVAALRAQCTVMARVADLAGHPPLRRRQGGFDGLCRIIVGQQVSVASAAAIWGRTEALVRPFTPARLLALSDAELASAGLSRPKMRTMRAIAQACVDGLDFAALEAASDAQVHAALTSVSGIGPWTADIYLMFCLGRADAWAPGDLALQIAAQWAMGLPHRPDADMLLEIAERWRPWRGVAARLLWAYYAVAKDQAQAIPV